MQVLLSCYIQLGSVEHQKCALLERKSTSQEKHYLLSEVSPSCLYSIMNLFQIWSKNKIWDHKTFCYSLLIAVAWCKTVELKPYKRSFFLSLVVNMRALWGKLRWLGINLASLEFTDRVSVYASVVNWLLSSRQSPTVAGIAVLLLPVLEL